MISIELAKSEDGKKRMFTISGHSGYAKSGSDIICSAISVLGQTSIEALTQLTKVAVSYNIDEENAYLKCEATLPDSKEVDYIRAETIFNTFEIGCKATAESYGNKYIKINNTKI